MKIKARFRENKPLQNGEIILYFTNVGKSCPRSIFYVANIYLRVKFIRRTSMALTLMSHSPGLSIELSSWSLQVNLCISHPGWLELPLARFFFMVPSLFEPLKFYCIWRQMQLYF